MIIATGSGMTTGMTTGTQIGTATRTMKIGAIAETAIASEMRMETRLRARLNDGADANNLKRSQENSPGAVF
jgi:hypothetical protein